ncbi:PREDICTED: transient receptor potential cation channel subfamily A member 1 homolog isoform X2 [Priapulus caudatus]|uniref:Transient receptor potential cation channel subfamily A member 1 homolog isoform X2 n=1 Tax=Priapulus caudatus TaxID=37621 RepID=A0ABM1F1R6_PRICU|nr:PREDICTED: transient receptor potential cation channel subfamily A member 1 homolog isoform X2 [Priapulus caudatus]
MIKVPVYSNTESETYDTFFESIRAGNVSKVRTLLMPEEVRQLTICKNEDPLPIYDFYHVPYFYRLKHMDINIQEVDTGVTPILLATKLGNKPLVYSIITCSGSVSAKDYMGNTALHLSILNERPDIMDLLLCNKADVDATNDTNDTPLHIACRQSKTGNRFIILKLLKAGADVYKKNKEGLTPMDLAAVHNGIEAVSLMLDYHQDLAARSPRSLIEAAIRGNDQVLELLLNFGMDPNLVVRDSKTGALHEAVRHVRYDAVRLLLAFGGDADLENGRNETPRSLLAGYPPLKADVFVRLLEEYEHRPRQIPLYADSEEDERLLMSPTLRDKEQEQEVTCLLDNDMDWTRLDSSFCGNYMEMNPNTNLLDNDPSSFWVIPSLKDAWVVFDFGSKYTLSGVRIYGWDSPQMIKTVQVQISRSGVDGPYVTVATIICDRYGSDDPADPAEPQDLQGFRETSRYWRLLVIDGHGGRCLCFQGVQFYGYDREVWNFFKELGLEEYALMFINSGYNRHSYLADIRQEDIMNVIEDKDKAAQLQAAVQDRCQREGRPLS